MKTLWEIAERLYADGRREEYEALKAHIYALDRSRVEIKSTDLAAQMQTLWLNAPDEEAWLVAEALAANGSSRFTVFAALTNLSILTDALRAEKGDTP